MLAEGHAVLRHETRQFDDEKPDKMRDPMLVDGGLVIALTKLVRGQLPWPLFLTGDVGSGKTCAGLCLIDAWGGWYLTVPAFLDRLIRAQKGELEYSSPTCVRKVQPYEVWGEIRAINLAVLDELGGREKVSDHHFESVKRLMDAREGKPTIYISNLSLTELGKVYDDRIASRLAFGTTVTLKDDRRVKKQEVENDDTD